MTSVGTPKLLSELKDGLERTYGTRLQGVYLYGSYATGDADAESDFDVLIVLDSILHYADEVDRTSELVATLSLRYGVSISRVFLTERDWQDGGTPFLNNARQEAVEV